MATIKSIKIKGARTHNLKNIDVEIPKNKLVVVTGVSGSGKSSLTIDTLYAEGQRRYVESLSSYARQFLSRMDKPDVDYIKGICPAIAIEQKVTTKTGRSTVGSLTEIYDYLRLLYARIGKTFSPVSGKEVKKHEVWDVIDHIFSLKENDKLLILSEVGLKDYSNKKAHQIAELLRQKGFLRLFIDNKMHKTDDIIADKKFKFNKKVEIVIDRFIVKNNEENRSRAADSVQLAFYEGKGECSIFQLDAKKRKVFNNRFELDGITFYEPSPHFFSSSNSYGACRNCEGFGTIIGIDHDLVIPNKNLSLFENGVVCWKGEKMKLWKEQVIKNAEKFDFPIHRPIKDLNTKQYNLLWTGNAHFDGLDKFFMYLQSESYKIQYRVMLSRYRGRTICTTCKGTRIRKETQYVKINKVNINELLILPIEKVLQFFDKIKLNQSEETVAKRILTELNVRLKTMCEIGLGYLTLNRLSNTLSGGETQRINLTRSIGSNLTNSLYILDEPSIGLHSKDTEKLISILKKLRDLGNTVIIVEHDEDIMLNADHIIDIGPKAGIFGGELIYNGESKKIKKNKNSLTAKYLNGLEKIEIPKSRRKIVNKIELKGAAQNNLKNIDVLFPLNQMVVISGVSGSGKTTLVKQILYPAIFRMIHNYGEKPGLYSSISGDINSLHQIEMIDQNPIGKSSRSNPVTYIKAYDAIRDLFSKKKLSKIRGYKPKNFSFNVDGGRCETCKGEGNITIEMQFLADVKLKCEECKGKRFKKEILEVKYKDKNISDVLNFTVDEAMDFFIEFPDVYNKIKPLQDVGLGYVKLGQSSSTLSGGEAQRVKLASYLGKETATKKILFIFDEPSTGLHFEDIKKLLLAFNALIENGHSVFIIEHNMDILKCADYIIDLGSEGGEKGGNLIFQGKPEEMLKSKKGYTWKFLEPKLKPKK